MIYGIAAESKIALCNLITALFLKVNSFMLLVVMPYRDPASRYFYLLWR